MTPRTKMLQGEWRAFALTDEHDRIRTLFRRRYGYLPDQIVRAGPIWLAGPIRCPTRAPDALDAPGEA